MLTENWRHGKKQLTVTLISLQACPCSAMLLAFTAMGLEHQISQAVAPPAELLPLGIVGLTGHRELRDPARIKTAIYQVLQELKQKCGGRLLTFSSIASGADALFAEESIALQLPWKVVLPFSKEFYLKSVTDEERRVVSRYLEKAYAVETMPLSEQQEDLYLNCGVRTVDDCDVLLAVWDGEPARGKGGTADVVAYAHQVKKPVIWIHAITGAIRREDFVDEFWRDAELEALNAIPEPKVRLAPWSPDIPSELTCFFAKVDAVATGIAPRFRRLTALTILLHLAATLTALVALAFVLDWILWPWLKVIFVVGAGVAGVYLAWKESHHHWIRCRLAAEICRSFIATWHIPNVFAPVALHDFPHLKGLLRVLRYRKELASHHLARDFDSVKDRYLQDRVENQRQYYHLQELTAAPLLRWLNGLFWLGTILAIVTALLFALAETTDSHLIEGAGKVILFHILPLAAPAVAGCALSLISVYDLKRRLSRYRQMQAELINAKSRIEACQTWDNLQRAVEQTEHLLVAEVVEWYSTAKYAGAH